MKEETHNLIGGQSFESMEELQAALDQYSLRKNKSVPFFTNIVALSMALRRGSIQKKTGVIVMKNLVLGIILLWLTPAEAAAGESGQLTATIIGSGSPRFNEQRASASVLISNGNTNILVDMGNGTQANLHKLGRGSRRLSALLFTHHHLDHNEEFVPLFIHSLLGRHPFQIIGPPGTVKLTEINLELYAEDIAYRLEKTRRNPTESKKAYAVRDIQGGESFKINKIDVATVEVPHSIHTMAYRFDYNGKSIVVTGDLTYTDNLATLARNADIMIIDSGGMIYSGGGNHRPKMKRGRPRQGAGGKRKEFGKRAHPTLHESSLMAKQAGVKNLVYTHFLPGKVDQEASLKKIRKNYSGNVIFGEDLMRLNDTGKNQPSMQQNK